MPQAQFPDKHGLDLMWWPVKFCFAVFFCLADNACTTHRYNDCAVQELRLRLIHIISALQHLMLGALIIRIGFGGPLYYNYNKEPPK